MKKILKRVLIGLGVLFVVGIALLAWDSRNTAKSEFDTLFSELENQTSSSAYCERGYGKGVSNRPWWERIYFNNGSPEESVAAIESLLIAGDYSPTTEYIVDSEDSYNLGQDYWEILAEKGTFSITARVSNGELTLNNCREREALEPTLSAEDFESVVVVKVGHDR